MSEAWIYVEPPRRQRHPPTEFASLSQPRAHPHAYSPTAHMERIGAVSAQAPRVAAVTPPPEMPPFGSAYRPRPVVRQPLPSLGEAARGVALGAFLALVLVAAFAVVHFHGL